MSRGVKGSTDVHALNLIAAGRIVCDPATGVILLDGKPSGWSAGAGGKYNRIHCQGVSMMSHRVVWLYVHGPIAPGLVINHRDGNPRNNRIGNLEAITQRQNVLHGIRHNDYRGTFPGEEVPSEFALKVASLPPDAPRGAILEALGIEPEPESDDIASLMKARVVA